MKLIHFADCHFSEKHHDEAEKCLSAIIQTARLIQPDAIICSGDTTDSQYLGFDTRSARTITRQFRELSDIAPVAVVRGTWSHDGNTPEILRDVSGHWPIHVSTEPEQICLMDGFWVPEASHPDLVITQIPAPTKEYWQNRQGAEQDNENIAQAMASIFAGFNSLAEKHSCPHVLNGHFSLVGSKISETQTLPGTEISVSKESLSMSGADLACLGHIHLAQEYEYQGGAAFHAGSPFRKDFGERGEQKGFYVHELVRGIWTSKFVTTPCRELIQVDLDLINDVQAGEANLYVKEEVANQVRNRIDDSWVKVVITLWMDEIRQINQSEIKRTLEDAGAKVTMEINRVRRENSRDKSILDAANLVEKVKALEKHRSRPAPDGLYEMLERIEVLNAEDLAKYAKKRLEPVEEKEKSAA